MATTNTLINLFPRDLVPEALGSPSEIPIAAGLYRGLSFHPGVNGAAYAVFRLPATASLGTGATVQILLSDDPLNPAPGLVTKFGVNFGLVGDGTARAIAAAALGTEATGTLTLGSTAGLSKELSIAIAVANMGSAAASKFVLFRIRRLGADATDTAVKGNVIVHGVAIFDT